MKHITQITYIMYIAVLLLGGSVGFFVGRMHPAQTAPNRGFPQGGTGRFDGSSAMRTMMRGPIMGSVLTKDAQSITLKTVGGGSRIIRLDPTTVYTKASSASAALVVEGTTLLVTGSPNTDGSITAQSIELR